MTYEECMNLVYAHENSTRLVDQLEGQAAVDAKSIRDYIGEFIGSLLYESPIGDGKRNE